MRQEKLNLSSWFKNPTHLKSNQQGGTELPMRYSNVGCEAEGKEQPGRKQMLKYSKHAEGY